MRTRRLTLDDCAIYLASPAEYEECVVLVEGPGGILFVVTDESRDGNFMIEPAPSELAAPPWTMSTKDVATLIEWAHGIFQGTRQSRL